MTLKPEEFLYYVSHPHFVRLEKSNSSTAPINLYRFEMKSLVIDNQYYTVEGTQRVDAQYYLFEACLDDSEVVDEGFGSSASYFSKYIDLGSNGQSKA